MTNPMIPNESELAGTIEEVQIDQDHQQGPGWFLKIAYVAIVVFMIYYCYANWNWQSDYQKHMEAEQAEIEQVSH